MLFIQNACRDENSIKRYFITMLSKAIARIKCAWTCTFSQAVSHSELSANDCKRTKQKRWCSFFSCVYMRYLPRAWALIKSALDWWTGDIGFSFHFEFPFYVPTTKHLCDWILLRSNGCIILLLLMFQSMQYYWYFLSDRSSYAIMYANI